MDRRRQQSLIDEAYVPQSPLDKKFVRPGDRVWVRISGCRAGYGLVVDTIDDVPKVPDRYKEYTSYTQPVQRNAFVQIAYDNFRGWFLASDLSWGRLSCPTKEQLKRLKQKAKKLQRKEENEETLKIEETEALKGLVEEEGKEQQPKRRIEATERRIRQSFAKTNLDSEYEYRVFLQRKAINGPSISDLLVLQVIQSQKKLRKQRRKWSRRDRNLKEEALTNLLCFSTPETWRKGADDDPSDDAFSMMSEIDLESSINWVPDHDQYKQQDDRYFPGDGEYNNFSDDGDHGHQQSEEFDQADDYFHLTSAAESKLLPISLFDLNASGVSGEGERNARTKLLSSLGFIGFDDDAADIGSTNNSLTTTTASTSSIWNDSTRGHSKTIRGKKSKEAMLEPEMNKLHELLRLGFISSKQFEVLKEEAREEIRIRKQREKEMHAEESNEEKKRLRDSVAASGSDDIIPTSVVADGIQAASESTNRNQIKPKRGGISAGKGAAPRGGGRGGRGRGGRGGAGRSQRGDDIQERREQGRGGRGGTASRAQTTAR